MRILKIWTVLLLSGLAVGCYKDKGNYDYSRVNDFEIVMNPATSNEFGMYKVNQPALDTAYFTLTAEVNQTETTGDENLEFEWIRTVSFENQPYGPYGPTELVTKTDTVYTATITLAFPPGRKTSTDLLCRVKDTETGIEYYKSVSVNTKVPFYDAWLILHGEKGSRQLGALEQEEDGTIRWTANMLTSMGVRDYPNMTGIAYSMFGNDPNEYIETERLFLISAPDSACAIEPFTCQPISSWGFMRPATRPLVEIAGDIQVHAGPSHGYAGFVDVDGRFYWGWVQGFFYEANADNITDCHVDLFYIGNQGYATLWDAQNKRFMYYSYEENQNSGFSPWSGGQRQDHGNGAQIKYFEGVTAAEMANKQVLYAGRGTATSNGDEAATMFIVQGERYSYLYEFRYSNKGGKSAKGNDGKEEAFGTVTRDSLSLQFNNDTRFATSEVYDGQLFYAQENRLSRVILHSKEEIQLHNVEGTIKAMRFRQPYFNNHTASAPNYRVLGLVVEKASGNDVLVEVYLDTAGDVVEVKEHVLEGVSKIVDIDFTNVARVMR